MNIQDLNDFIDKSKENAKRQIKRILHLSEINKLEEQINGINELSELYKILYKYPEYERLKEIQNKQLEIYYTMLIGFIKKGDIYNAASISGKIELIRQQIKEPEKIKENMVEYKKSLEKMEGIKL
ncbi:MAG: hypothetical protein PHY08_09055 [Candidatus Cloacimonetes bacterium]|nr:hypothetical protein [Candidatus Cloacimonadota bacterium]